MGRAKKSRKARMANKMARSIRRSKTPVLRGGYPFLDSFYRLPDVSGIDSTRMKKLMDDLGRAAAKIKIEMPRLGITPEMIEELSASNKKVNAIFKSMNVSSNSEKIMKMGEDIVKMVDEMFKGEDEMEQDKQYVYENLIGKLRGNIFRVNPETVTVIFNQVAQVASEPKVGYRVDPEDNRKVTWLSVKPGSESMEFGELMVVFEDHLDKVPYGTFTVVYNQVAGLVGIPQMTQVEGDVGDLSVYGEDAAKWEAMEV